LIDTLVAASKGSSGGRKHSHSKSASDEPAAVLVAPLNPLAEKKAAAAMDVLLKHAEEVTSYVGKAVSLPGLTLATPEEHQV
jgi:hypothetical protein